ncbi:neogenin isoform X6 [Brachionus plicatilis]|uniref:Neogenin isoform X6 n=1 Tax=Brachionus plicatilis TaxID=10195 RepID=A0A3M7S1K0_BRAPC|nr:neogenin isoform X6 [Brachionus plicatilis]
MSTIMYLEVSTIGLFVLCYFKDSDLKSKKISHYLARFSQYTIFKIKGYIIYYLDEKNFKENKRWNNEIINAFQSSNQLMKHTIKSLKPETIYYFKIQARNSRAYGTSSSTVLFRTPDQNGVGGGQIITSSDSDQTEPTVVLNKNENSPLHKVQLEISFIWVITACISALFLIVVILVAVLVCKKTEPKSKDKNFNRNNLTSSTRPFKNRSERSNELDEDESYQKSALLHQQQQQLLNTIPNLSSNSTLLKQKTPHHQPLLINNPNHMMMNVMNPLSLSNTQNSDMEFYANSQAGLFTNNSHANSETSCFNSEQHYQIQNSTLMQMNNFNGIVRNGPSGDQYSDEQTNSAIQAANAAFNSPFNPNFIPTVNLNQNNDTMFLRQTAKPKPIAIPINSGSNSGQSPLDQPSIFSANNPTRKSYKNLRTNVHK